MVCVSGQQQASRRRFGSASSFGTIIALRKLRTLFAEIEKTRQVDTFHYLQGNHHSFTSCIQIARYIWQCCKIFLFSVEIILFKFVFLCVSVSVSAENWEKKAIVTQYIIIYCIIVVKFVYYVYSEICRTWNTNMVSNVSDCKVWRNKTKNRHI